MADGVYINWRDVEANKRRTKERVRERERVALLNFLYKYHTWIVPVGVLVIAMWIGIFLLILEIVL